MANEDDFDLNFKTLRDEQMNPSNEREKQQRIEELKVFLKDGFDEYSSPSTSTLNDSTKRNAGGRENMNGQKQFELINNDNSSSMNSSCDDMDVDEVNKKSEQISSDPDTKKDEEQCSDTVNENNDNTNIGEKQINGFEYMRQFLQTCNSVVAELEPKLVQSIIPTKITEDYFKNFRVPLSDQSNPSDPDLPNKLSILLQKGIDLLKFFRPICSTHNITHPDPTGEESNENSERTTSAPSEDNGDYLDRHIHVPMQSKLSTSTTPKDADTTALSLSLRQLLSQAKKIGQELNLTKLKIANQPRELWTKRTINCLEQKWNVCIQDQSGKQQSYPCIEWSKLTKNDRENLFVLVQLLSWNDHPHSSNIIVPAGTRIRRPKQSQKRKNATKTRLTLKNLVIENGYAFNEKHRAVLCPITVEEYEKCAKFLQLIMFSLYKNSEEIADTNDAQDFVDNIQVAENEENGMEMDTDEEDENEENEADHFLEYELRKISKFRICLCQQTKNNELEYISNFVDTGLILQCKGSTRSRLAIDEKKVTPKELCRSGKEWIILTFNKSTDAKGIVVRLNGDEIQGDDNFQVKKKQILIRSRPNTAPGQQYLIVEVSKKCILETIKKNKNPYGGLEENKFLKIKISYVEQEQSNNEHEHVDTNAKTFTLIQSNEISETQSLTS